MVIDLHVHSSASDGTEAPAEVMAAAAAAGVRVIALTDHDTTAGWAEAAGAAVDLGLALVPGAELSCSAGGISVHLLAYLPDPEHAALWDEVALTRADRVHRARAMVERISADHDLTWADVLEHVPADGAVGRPHIADALVTRGVVADRDEAFAGLLHSSSPYYRTHRSPDAVRLVRLVREAGGVPVMAHPRAGRRGRVVTDDVVADLAAAGLAALEVDHRDHEPDDREHLRGLAAELGLLTTGSSDYHGTGKTNRLAENTTEPHVLEAILAQGTGASPVGPLP